MALLDNAAQNGGLLNFLRQPETMALAQGLLAGAQPSMTQPSTFGGAFAQGLKAMEARAAAEEDRKIRARLAAVQEGTLGIESEYKHAQIQKLQHEIALQQQQQQFADNLLTPQNGMSQPQFPMPESQPPYQGAGALNYGQEQALPGILQNGYAPIQPPLINPQVQREIWDAGGIAAQRNQKKIDEAHYGNKPQSDMVTLSNGMQVSEKNYQEAVAARASGDKNWYKALFKDKPKETAVIEEAKFFHPGDVEKQREYIKNKGIKSKVNEPTTSFITTNQEIIQAVNNVIPALDEIINSKDIPGYYTGSIFSPTNSAKYNADVITISEALLKARGLNNSAETLNKIIKTIEIQPREDEEAYRERIKGVKKEVLKRKERSERITQVGKEEQAKTVTVYKGGQKYNVPESEVQEALADGGSLNG